MRNSRKAAWLGLLCLLLSNRAEAQVRAKASQELLDSLAARVQQSEVTQAMGFDIAGILRDGSSYPIAARQRLADTLLRRGLTDAKSTGAVVLAFASAGRANARAPWPASADALETLYHAAPDSRERCTALAMMSFLADRGKVLALWRSAATELKPPCTSGARVALSQLMDAGEAGHAILRELQERGEVKEPWARGDLGIFVRILARRSGAASPDSSR